MSTNAGTMKVPSRPVGFTVWATIVSAFAAAALIMSAVALIQTRTSSGEVASISTTLWDTGRLEAMEGRALAETVETTGTLWDTGRLEAMEGRALAETVGAIYTLWDESKLEAARGRSASEAIVIGTALWDAGKLEAMQGRVLAA